MKFLNIACGERIHKDWVNIDFHKYSDDVIPVNVLKTLPFKDKTFDVVYSSHFFEHISRENADFVLSEISRVLRESGILRIVVPDLENICKEYLKILSNIEKEGYQKKYEWITIELLDQIVRTESGGEIGKLYKNKAVQRDKLMAKYIKNRVGVDINSSVIQKSLKITPRKIKEFLLYRYVFFIRGLLPKLVRESLFLKTSIGERHVWMYDKYSLGEKVKKFGFEDIKFFKHDESQIENFKNYFLDTNKDGTPYKGESSLYCEARRQ